MKINQKGMTLVEVLISLLLVSVIIFATVTFISSAFRTTAHNQEKEFATQKAISILDELKSFVEDKQGVGSLLDDFSENSDSPVLTIQDGAVPDDPVSANVSYASSPSGWLYTKQITVTPIGDADNRLVNVKVFTYKYGKQTLISEVAGVLRTIAPSFAPTQVYDVYLIAIDNIPGWWVYMQNIVPFVQATLQDIQSRNPGLEFRTHWIRKLSYGRDWQYAPYFNEATVSTANINKTYFYPGQLPVNDATYDTPGNIRPVSFYYLPSLVQARFSKDGTIVNGYDNNPANSTYNPYPYSLADTYNNAMRYPDEKEWFDNRVSVGKEFADAPTYRLLIEDMWQNPSKYRNAIVINLHGELFPFPPIRNYSDPARDPVTYTNAAVGFPRVVTHPQQLRYTNNDNMVLRVYSYLNRLTSLPANNSQNMQFLPAATPITVRLNNITWTPATGDIKTIIGGADLNGDNVADAWGGGPVNAAVCPVAGNNACYTASMSGGDTVLTLVRSPLVSTQVGGAGLNSNYRLYGMEYIPAPMEIPPFTNGGLNDAFSINLTTASGGMVNGPKNTARWIITVPDGVLPDNSMVTIETRIGSDPTLGTMYPTKNNPQDLSKTYTWRGDDTWIFGDSTFANPGHLPITERWQIIGDPRHLPYADQKTEQIFGATTFALGSGFNRYFDDFNNTGSGYAGASNQSGLNAWQGWTVAGVGIKANGAAEGSWTTTATDDGWDVTEAADVSAGFGAQGMLEVDVNRIMQVFRTVLLRTNSVFTTLSGFSFSYLGMGNEIDYDQSNGFISGVPVSSMPFTGTGGARYERSITSWPTDLSSTYHLKYIKRNNNTWFAKYWLGELFPDDVYATQWDTNGNLTAGTGATDFLRVIRSSIPDTAPTTPATDLLPTGTTFVPSGRTTDEEGSTAFMNIGSSTNQFHHEWSYDNVNALVDETGDLQSPEGVEIANKFYMPFPTTAPIGRPFYLNSTGEGKMPNGFISSGNPPFYDTGYTIAGAAANGVHPVGTLSTTYYDSTEDRYGTGTGSGLVTLRETYNGVERGAIYNVVNGLDKTGESGTTLIGKWSVLSLTDAFLRSGQGASNTRIRELPRVLILPFTAAELNNQPALNIQWSMNWLRWDGQEYVDAYPNGFTVDTETGHVILYSIDNGVTWKNIMTDAVATPGVRPTAAGDYVIPKDHDPTDNSLSYNWTGFGDRCEGTILLRVEVYRDIDNVDSAFNLHYAYHQMRIFRRDPDDTGCF